MASEFITRTGDGEYQVIFKTDDKKHYRIVEDLCREIIDHKKPDEPIRVVRCRDCKYKPTRDEEGFEDFPVCGKCPLECVDDPYYSRMPSDNWFCANGEKEGDEQ